MDAVTDRHPYGHPTPGNLTPPASSPDQTVVIGRLRPAGPGQPAGQRPAHDNTVLLSAVAGGSEPVFVDSSGRRRRRLRLMAFWLGVACLGYTGLVGIGLLGGASGTQALLPLPGLVGGNASPSPTVPPTPVPASVTRSSRPTATRTATARTATRTTPKGQPTTPKVTPDKPPPTTPTRASSPPRVSPSSSR